ncbi:hypothetical protein ACVFI8_00260 [Agarivorans sp. MS3-6]
MKFTVINVLLVALVSILANPVRAASHQLIRHIEGLSRDYYYLNIDQANQPFERTDIVGGEHENHYFILGFQGDQFVVSIESKDGEASYSLTGEGYLHQTLNSTSDNGHQFSTNAVVVDQQRTWIGIAVSAHPFAEYTLRVRMYE